MAKLTEEDFIKMANKIYINPSQEVLTFLKKEYEEIDQSLKTLKEIEITNVEPLVRIAPAINYLREDEVDQELVLDKKVALNNAKEKNEDFVIIKRIFK